jgi:hypothetical protein
MDIPAKEMGMHWKQKQFYFKCPFSSGPGQEELPGYLTLTNISPVSMSKKTRLAFKTQPRFNMKFRKLRLNMRNWLFNPK